MTLLEEIIAKHDDCYYHQDTDSICIFDANDDRVTIESGAKELIELHFDGETLPTGENTDPNGGEETLTGEEYVKHLGGVSDAYRTLGLWTY